MRMPVSDHAPAGAVKTLDPPRRTGAEPKIMQSGLKISDRGRQHSTPVPVEATVYWWVSDESRSSNAPNHFGVNPPRQVRFRCIGSLTPKYPQRYRVELAQALDWLPYLARNEMKGLAASLALTISKKLGVDVAPVSEGVIDLKPASDN